MIDAAKEIGSALNQTTMAVMLGNAWNDLVQPFWILPALAPIEAEAARRDGLHRHHDAVGGVIHHRRVGLGLRHALSPTRLPQTDWKPI